VAKDKYSKLFKLQTGHSYGAISESLQTALTNLQPRKMTGGNKVCLYWK